MNNAAAARRPHNSPKGQHGAVMIEYIVALTVLLSCLLFLNVFLRATATRAGNRTQQMEADMVTCRTWTISQVGQAACR